MNVNIVSQLRTLCHHGHLEARQVYERCDFDSRSDRPLCRGDLPEVEIAKERHLDRTAAFNRHRQGIWRRPPHRGPFEVRHFLQECVRGELAVCEEIKVYGSTMAQTQGYRGATTQREFVRGL